LKFDKLSFDILIDSGASRSLISELTAKALKLKFHLYENRIDCSSMFSANGSKIRITGTAEVRLFMKGVTSYQTVHAAPQLLPGFLFGFDFFVNERSNLGLPIRNLVSP